MTIRAPKDFWAGLMFLAFAAVTLAAASGYSLGRGGRMGPGYFPTLLGAVLALLGVILVVRSFALTGERIGRFEWRPLVVLVACVILFGATIQWFGLVVSLTATTFLASFAGREFRLLEAAALSIGLTIASLVIFVAALGLPLPVWPSF